MKRREFVIKSATLAAGGMVLPYILPSGRLFARTNAPKADHVVFVIASTRFHFEALFGR